MRLKLKDKRTNLMSLDNNSIGKLSVGPSLVTDGLILYLDAASKRSYVGGSTWTDLTKNSNNFEINGGVQHNGKYFSLNGSTSQYFQSNPFSHPTEDFTIELYERITEFNLTPFYSYAVLGDDNEGLLYLPSDSSAEIQIRGPAGQVNTGFAIELNKFYQIARVRISSSGDEKLYINGDLAFEGTLAAGQSTQANGSFNVGQEQDSPGGGFRDTQTIIGDVSIVRVYDRALSPQEISTNYQEIQSRFIGV